MNVKFHLVINSRGSVRTCKNKPDTRADEIAVAVNMNVPNELFKKPVIEAKIEIPKDAVASRTIEADTQQAIKESIESISGLTVELAIKNPEN